VAWRFVGAVMPDGTSAEQTTTVPIEVTEAGDAEAAVVALVNLYAERLDAGDFDGVAALFARAVWRSAQHPAGLRGAEAVRRVYDGVQLHDGTPRTKHVLSNLVVEVDASMRAVKARCSFTVLQAVDDGPPRLLLAGRYHDAFAWDESSWHFIERVTLVDLVGDLTRHFRPE
jgi:hypothetical protein